MTGSSHHLTGYPQNYRSIPLNHRHWLVWNGLPDNQLRFPVALGQAILILQCERSIFSGNSVLRGRVGDLRRGPQFSRPGHWEGNSWVRIRRYHGWHSMHITHPPNLGLRELMSCFRLSLWFMPFRFTKDHFTWAFSAPYSGCPLSLGRFWAARSHLKLLGDGASTLICPLGVSPCFWLLSCCMFRRETPPSSP